MNQQKTTLEVIAPSVEEAVEKGLAQLGLPQERVDVDVLDAGARGLFGLGMRQARVRLTVKEETDTAAPRMVVQESAVQVETAAPGSQDVLEVATTVVRELLDKMRVRAQVKAQLVDEGQDEEKTILIEILGNDLSILIGKRSETLNALQYISSLIVSKELGHWVPMMIDVQGYRTRRERQLRILAKKLAEQAVNTGRRQVLEPMPANERRVIHLELRNHPQVTTESVGDEPNRKVTILPKK